MNKFRSPRKDIPLASLLSIAQNLVKGIVQQIMCIMNFDAVGTAVPIRNDTCL